MIILKSNLIFLGGGRSDDNGGYTSSDWPQVLS